MIRQSRETFDTDYADRKTLDMYWRRVSENGQFPLKETAELTAAAFTGVRLNCAQCHKHPFDRWTQDDYAAFANIFSNVVYGNSTELNKAIFAELEARREQKQKGQQVQPLPRLREVFISDSLGRPVAGSEKGVSVAPRAFESGSFEADEDLRQQFFDWLVRPDNAYFARNFANRAWSVYFGVGIVEPVDDFSISNPPSHPRLLDELARSFRDSNFDIRKLEKTILMSGAYQRTSTPNETNHADRRNFARQYVRPLRAEVALDCINKALGTAEEFGNDAPPNALAIEIGTNQVSGKAGRALTILGRGRRQSVCDCDRRKDNDLRQFVFLINDKSVFEKIESGEISKLLMMNDPTLLNELYLRILGRTPGQDEMKIGLKHLGGADERETAFDDLV